MKIDSKDELLIKQLKECLLMRIKIGLNVKVKRKLQQSPMKD